MLFHQRKQRWRRKIISTMKVLRRDKEYRSYIKVLKSFNQIFLYNEKIVASLSLLFWAKILTHAKIPYAYPPHDIIYKYHIKQICWNRTLLTMRAKRLRPLSRYFIFFFEEIAFRDKLKRSTSWTNPKNVINKDWSHHSPLFKTIIYDVSND